MPVSHFLAPASPPVLSQTDAIRLFQRIRSNPSQSETLVLALDHNYVCTIALTVRGSSSADELIGITTWLALVAQHRSIAAIVLGSVRPAGCIRSNDGPLWFELLEAAAAAEMEFLDLFILGRYGIVSVGDTLGFNPLWVP